MAAIVHGLSVVISSLVVGGLLDGLGERKDDECQSFSLAEMLERCYDAQYSQFVSQNSAGDKPGGMGTPLVIPGTSTHPNSRAGSSGATRQSRNG